MCIIVRLVCCDTQAERLPVHTSSHLGPLTQLTLGFRASFPGDRWHPDRLEVSDEATGLLYVFFCQAWLGDDNQNSMKLKVNGRWISMCCALTCILPSCCSVREFT